MNTLEDDIRAVLHSQANAIEVPEPHLSRFISLTRVVPQPRRRHLVPMNEIDVSVDTPTSEIRNRRRPVMAAAAVVAVIGTAAIAINNTSSDDGDAPVPAAAPTTVAPTTVAPRPADFIEGVTYPVPDDWKNIRYGVVKGDPAFGVIFGNPGDIYYTSFCPWVSVGQQVGPTVDDLVSAWANLPGVDATAARDVTIDGFHAKQIEFTVPENDEGDCNGMWSRCSLPAPGLRQGRCDSMLWDADFPSDESYLALPNQHQKVTILDVDGSRLVIMAGFFPDTSPEDRATLDEIVASIQIDSPARTGAYVGSDFRVGFAVPAGWVDNDSYVSKVDTDPIFAVAFDEVDNIYTDSCPSVLVDPPVGPTVDDLASAWANLPGFDAAAVSDITVDGFHGKQVEFTVPNYNEEDCPYGMFNLWNSVGGGRYRAQGPNQHHQLWILDVNGTRLVIVTTSFPDTSPQDEAALDEILASIQIG